MRMQQAICRAERRFPGLCGEARFKGHEGFARLAVNLLASVQLQQLCVQGGLEGGQQGLAFSALQIVLGQTLVQRAALVQELLTVLLEKRVQALQISQVCRRGLRRQQRAIDIE